MTDAWTSRPSLAMRIACAALPIVRDNRAFRSTERMERVLAANATRAPVPASPPRSYARKLRIAQETLGPLRAAVAEPAGGRASVRSLIWLHGGGYVHQLEAAHWWLIASLVRTLRVRVIAPDYLLAPAGTAERGIADVAAVVRAVAERDGAAPVLAGDSAGGGLALAVALGLRGEAVAPAHLVLAAPALDLTLANPEVPSFERRDPMLGAAGMHVVAPVWSGGLDPRDPRVSPGLAADYGGLPPTSLVVGTRDLLYPDARDFAARARADGVDIATFTASDAFHVFIAAARLPEARAARSWLARRLAPYWVV